MRCMLGTGIVKDVTSGLISKALLPDEDAARLAENNLVTVSEGNYYLNIPCFRMISLQNLFLCLI